MSHRKIWAWAALAYLGIGLIMAVIWQGFTISLAHPTAWAVILLWPMFAALHLAAGILRGFVSLIALIAFSLIAGFAYLGYSQRRNRLPRSGPRVTTSVSVRTRR